MTNESQMISVRHEGNEKMCAIREASARKEDRGIYVSYPIDFGEAGSLRAHLGELMQLAEL